MKEKLNLIRQPLKTDSTAASIRNSALIFIFGAVLGVFAKWLDNLELNNNIWWHRTIEKFDLANVFSDFPIWLLLSLVIAIFSYNPLKSAINTFLFLGGMCIAYHIYTVNICGFEPLQYMKIWYGITIISPLLAVMCWYGKGTHPVSVIIDVMIITILASLCFSIGIIYFSFTNLINAVIFALALIVIYRDPKQLTPAFIIGVFLAFPLSRFIHEIIPG